MPSSSLVRAAIFPAGAAVGGGVATVLGRKKAQDAAPLGVPIYAPPVTNHTPSNTPAVSLGASGAPVLAAGVPTIPVLRYGNPGPVSDQFVRQAYVAAYDRRLRHPAWVRGLNDCTVAHSYLYHTPAMSLQSNSASNGGLLRLAYKVP